MVPIETSSLFGGERLKMAAGSPPSFDQAFAVLRQFARSPRPAERCELCSAALAHEHPHLVEISLRQIVCACEACATLFDGMARGKYRRVSRRAQLLANFQMTDAQWENLLIPINMAFFFQSSVEGKVVALYPSPAGAVESLLPLDAWNEIVQENPILNQLEPDIEALLVNRVGHAHEWSRPEDYIAPIPRVYRLFGFVNATRQGV